MDEQPKRYTPLEYSDNENERYEQMMSQWDSWISYYLDGGRGTWPRDAFEALIEYYEETTHNKRG